MISCPEPLMLEPVKENWEHVSINLRRTHDMDKLNTLPGKFKVLT